MQYVMSALLAFSFFVQGERREGREAFSSVPPQQRVRLMQRFGSYISCERRQDYGRLYDLLSEATKNPKYLKLIGGTSPLQSKSEYVKFRKSSYPKVLAFVPSSSKNLNDGGYEIRGQATLRYKGGVGRDERMIVASLENGEWYFSELLEIHEQRYEAEPIKDTPGPLVTPVAPRPDMNRPPLRDGRRSITKACTRPPTRTLSATAFHPRCAVG